MSDLLLDKNHNYTDNNIVVLVIDNTIKDIYDIMSNVKFLFDGNMIKLNYQSGTNDFTLWYVNFMIKWNIAIIDEFYTSNFKWLDTNWLNKSNLIALNYIPILKKPIPYIWKELFREMIKIFQQEWVKSVWLTYRKDSNSIEFYQKIFKFFPKSIINFSNPYPWSIFFNLA